MKVAYLLGSLNRGGTEILQLDVFKNADKQHLSAIGVYRKGGELEHDFNVSGLMLYKLAVGQNLLTYLRRLRKLLLEQRITLVHAHQPIDALFAYLALWGTSIPVILSIHGYDFQSNFFSGSILRFILRRTRRNVFVSAAVKNYYVGKYKLCEANQTVVYNGVSFDKLKPTHTTTHIRSTLNIGDDTLLLGTVGNFLPGRDQLTLCRFLNELKQRQIPFHFVFIGKRVEAFADLYDSCVNYCSNNELSEYVSFLGSRTDVGDILGQLDAFLYATDHDTFGLAVVEAMATGIPVFVNDWDVMREITDDGKHATLYKTKNETDLVREFVLFLQNKPTYQNKAADAAKFVRDNYSIEKHIEKLKEVYRS